jgi:hypothetical protein
MERSSALSHVIRPSSEFPFVFHYRQFDGLRLAHLDEGAGAAVVFIHGRLSFDRATGDMVIADVGGARKRRSISLTPAVAGHGGVTAGPGPRAPQAAVRVALPRQPTMRNRL